MSPRKKRFERESCFSCWCLLSALTNLVNVMLRGEVPQFAVPILYDANECAIRKRDGGIRPIAVGSTIRRLSVKVGSSPVLQAHGEELRPVQLEVSTSVGCEAAALAARRCVRDCRHRRVLLKIDMHNAFNSLIRDSFLSVACVRTPGLYSLLWQAYSLISNQIILLRGGVCLRDRYPAGRTNWTRPLCSIGWWSSPRCPDWIQCEVFGRRYLRTLPEEGSRRFSGFTGEAQSIWTGGQWEQMRAHHSQWEHAGGKGGPVQRAPSGG